MVEDRLESGPGRIEQDECSTNGSLVCRAVEYVAKYGCGALISADAHRCLEIGHFKKFLADESLTNIWPCLIQTERFVYVAHENVHGPQITLPGILDIVLQHILTNAVGIAVATLPAKKLTVLAQP